MLFILEYNALLSPSRCHKVAMWYMALNMISSDVKRIVSSGWSKEHFKCLFSSVVTN